MKNKYGESITYLRLITRRWLSRSTGMTHYVVGIYCNQDTKPSVVMEGSTRTPDTIVLNAVLRGIRDGKLPRPNATFRTLLDYCLTTDMKFNMDYQHVPNKKQVILPVQLTANQGNNI